MYQLSRLLFDMFILNGISVFSRNGKTIIQKSHFLYSLSFILSSTSDWIDPFHMANYCNGCIVTQYPTEQFMDIFLTFWSGVFIISCWPWCWILLIKTYVFECLLFFLHCENALFYHMQIINYLLLFLYLSSIALCMVYNYLHYTSVYQLLSLQALAFLSFLPTSTSSLLRSQI